jgi:DNA polymerase V
MTGIKNKSGGARKGSGRKQKYGEPTKSVRVPISLLPDLLKKMDKLEKKNKKP